MPGVLSTEAGGSMTNAPRTPIMPKRDLALILVIFAMVAVVAFLFLGDTISVILEQNPPNNAI